MNMINGVKVGAALAKLGTVAVSVASQLIAAIPGGVTGDEAELIARQVMAEEDIAVRVNGVDIVDMVAQDHLVSALARIGRNLVSALRQAK